MHLKELPNICITHLASLKAFKTATC